MSLLGYFWLLNALSCLDAVVTILGIEMGILYERNPIVNYFLENFGLNRGMLIVKGSMLLLTVLMFKLHEPDTNVVRNSYIALIALYLFAVSQMTVTIYLAATHA